jgi:hypothetical protein
MLHLPFVMEEIAVKVVVGTATGVSTLIYDL